MAFPGISSRSSQRAAPSAPADSVPHGAVSPRALRAQAVHRLQVGLFGLAGMLLLVSLANVIMDRAQVGDASAGVGPDVAASASASPASDPLVDMGVVPELPGNKPAASPSPSASAPASGH